MNTKSKDIIKLLSKKHCNDIFESGEFKGEKLEGKVVGYFRHTDIDGSLVCDTCGEIFHNHGWIDRTFIRQLVCPSDYIIKISNEFFAINPHIAVKLFDID